MSRFLLCAFKRKNIKTFRSQISGEERWLHYLEWLNGSFYTEPDEWILILLLAYTKCHVQDGTLNVITDD